MAGSRPMLRAEMVKFSAMGPWSVSVAYFETYLVRLAPEAHAHTHTHPGTHTHTPPGTERQTDTPPGTDTHTHTHTLGPWSELAGQLRRCVPCNSQAELCLFAPSLSCQSPQSDQPCFLSPYPPSHPASCPGLLHLPGHVQGHTLKVLCCKELPGLAGGAAEAHVPEQGLWRLAFL